MLDEFRYILLPISIKMHPEWGAYIELIDCEHRDYIEDVFHPYLRWLKCAGY